MKRGLCLAAIALAIACDHGASARDVEAKPTPVDALVMLDLSLSITEAQRAALANLVVDYVAGLPEDSQFGVRILETQMLIGSTLIDGIVPARGGTIRAKGDWRRTVEGWRADLARELTEVLNSETSASRLTSCYIKSSRYAARYFAGRPSGMTKQIVWFGDLVEDCHVDEYRRFGLPHDGLKSLARFQQAEQLTDVIALGIITPRARTDHSALIDPDAVYPYWDSLGPRLGLTSDRLRLGPPESHGIKPALDDDR